MTAQEKPARRVRVPRDPENDDYTDAAAAARREFVRARTKAG